MTAGAERSLIRCSLLQKGLALMLLSRKMELNEETLWRGVSRSGAEDVLSDRATRA
jgi:hypothetical protein